jgi:hypothetical protein
MPPTSARCAVRPDHTNNAIRSSSGTKLSRNSHHELPACLALIFTPFACNSLVSAAVLSAVGTWLRNRVPLVRVPSTAPWSSIVTCVTWPAPILATKSVYDNDGGDGA